MLVFPVVQVSIFYIYVNFNSFVLAFQDYSIVDGKYMVSFAQFENFKQAFNIFTSNLRMVKNSLILYALSVLVGFTLALIFSFYIYKKFIGSKLFQVILFMPNLISSLVFSILFSNIVGDVYINVTGAELGLLSNFDTMFGTILFYNVWIGFGVNVILFSGAMSGIDESVVEASHLDGANIVQEFVKVSIPMIFPTLVSFIIIGMVGIFTNQMNLVNFFGTSADMEIATFGYYLYAQAALSDVIPQSSNVASYPVLSALGLILTCIMLPLVMSVRKLLDTFGPRVD